MNALNHTRPQLQELERAGIDSAVVAQVRRDLVALRGATDNLAEAEAEIAAQTEKLQRQVEVLKERRKVLSKAVESQILVATEQAGGVRVQVGDLRLTVTSATTTETLNDNALSGDVLKALTEAGVIVRRPRVDEERLAGAIEAGTLDRAQLVADGVIVEKAKRASLRMQAVKGNLK